MRQPISNTIRFLGALAGLLVGVGLGALVGMGFNNVLVAAVLGGTIGLILGVCFPTVAGYILGDFLEPF
jgi:predicted lysophospholipase L1 biosynthesis ABC-type transport system permease subunit